MGGRLVLAGAVMGLAAVAALVPVDAGWVERWFSTGLYPRLAGVVTPLANLVPFALFDLILITAAVLLVARVGRGIGRARRERRLRPIGDMLLAIGAAAAAIYLLFLLMWGLNYRRTPMAERLVMSDEAPGPDAALRLGRRAVERLNALHVEAHMRGWQGREWQDLQMQRAFADVQQALSAAPPVAAGRLKWTALGPYFRWAGVDGMVDPFALEALANPDLLPFERPFVAAHEWGHLAGFADEAEASFVGFLTCLRAGVPAEYSGWLFLYWQLAADLTSGERASLAGMLADGPRRDLDAIAERLRRGQLPRLRAASWMVYDSYLRANRVEDGIRSYGAVVTLILRSRLDDGSRPVRRDAPASTAR